MRLAGQSDARFPEISTHGDGLFTFPALPAGSYTLSAEKPGLHSRSYHVDAESSATQKQVSILLDEDSSTSAASSTPTMEFADKPNFTVAGVTDWTAVGGHGSDSTLRTSEDLARETLALKAKGAENSTSAGSNAAKEFVQSESRLRLALAGAPGSFEANHQLGELYLHAGRYQDAVPLLRAAYSLDPAHRGNERDLAIAYEETGDLAQARDHVEKMLSKQDSADLHRLLGEMDEKMSDPLAAVHQDEQAVRLDPSEQNYFAWGSELLLHRAVWQAVEVFKSGATTHPDSARMLTALGTAQFAGALYDEAAASLCQASDLNSAAEEPYLFMGKIELAAPSPLPCIEPKLARFVQQQPENSMANYFYAMAILKRQSQPPDPAALQQVEMLLGKAVAIDNHCAEGYLQLGILAAAQHAPEKAVGYYNKAIEANPQLGEAHYRLGVAYDRMGDSEKARQEFQLHDQIEKQQADVVERQRREVKQFLVVLEGQHAAPSPAH